MLQQSGVTERLANFVVATRWSDLPNEVAHQAKRSLLNFFAVALTGCRNETFEIALGALSAFSGGEQATLIGRRERIDALNAAFLNAAGANVLDFCDTHVPTAIHPTAPLAPALLALAELQRVSGRDLLLAFVLGQEIECRVGLAMSPSHYNRGWHITATCGVFGAAAGSGRAFGAEPAADGVGARQRGDAGRRPVRMSWHRGKKRRRRQFGARRPAVGAAGGEEFRRPCRAAHRHTGLLQRSQRDAGLGGDHRRSRRDLGDLEDLLQALSVRLRAASGARLRARLAARQSGGRRRAGQGHRQSAARAARRPPEDLDQRPIAGQRAARRRRRACHRQGRRRTVRRGLRERSDGRRAARQSRGDAR